MKNGSLKLMKLEAHQCHVTADNQTVAGAVSNAAAASPRNCVICRS
jgi:hypothetical protein